MVGDGDGWSGTSDGWWETREGWAGASDGWSGTSDGWSEGGEAGEGVGQDGCEGRLRLELRQHPDAAEPDPVDQQVLRRQVDLEHRRVAGGAGIVDAVELSAHPGPGE